MEALDFGWDLKGRVLCRKRRRGRGSLGAEIGEAVYGQNVLVKDLAKLAAGLVRDGLESG